MHMLSGRRIVITGIGMITPLGKDASSTWEGFKNGRSGITKYDKDYLPLPIGRVEDIDFSPFFKDSRFIKRLDRFNTLGIVAAKMAMKDSGITEISDELAERFGVCVGSGIGGLNTFEEQIFKLNKKGHRALNPFFIPSAIVNICSGFIAMEYNLHGVNFAIGTACATSNHNIGEAWKNIKHGYADCCLAGGAEATLLDSGIGAFNRMKALSSRDCPPEEASCPFDSRRDGFVIAEGAGVVLLEEYDLAKKRGARIYAEIVGYGANADGYHITSPHPEGAFAKRAMEIALEQAKVNPEEVDYISAHGTSTPLGDACETKAIKEIFGFKTDIPVSSIKSMIGHTLGASGAIEIIACLMSFKDGILPPTINLLSPDSECDLDYIPNTAREKEITYALSNSFGFGGHNSSLLLKKI